MTPQRAPSDELLSPNLSLARKSSESSVESWDISPRGSKQQPKPKPKHSKSKIQKEKRKTPQDTNPNPSSATNSSTESPSPSSNPRNGFSITKIRSSYTPSQEVLSRPLRLGIDTTMASQTRLLVCSIGNPAPYTNTLHSAGHMLLNTLSTTLSFPPFQKSRAHANGLLSASFNPDHQNYTFWQSPTLMNVSGPAVAKAWAQFNRDTPAELTRRLVVIHDELELPLGQVKVKKGEASAKGHNGLKSIKEQVQGPWWRIGVGIGRPVSREPDVVAGFVLRKCTMGERERIEGAVGRVEAELRRLCSGG